LRERVAAAVDLPAVPPEAAQQKDNLCGAFWAARIIREFGITSMDGQPIDEDLIALKSATVLPDSGPVGALPPGAVSLTSYRYVSAASGALHCVPIRGQWTAERVARLVEGARAIGGARLIANLRTGRFWGSHPPLTALIDELAGRPAPDPTPDWDVGHYVELAGLITGEGGALVHVHDTYPSLGWDGHHLQPPRVVAAALLRGDGREGGVLVVVPAGRAAEVESLAAGLDLDIGIWDNGVGS
jgi:hypothetical protein